MIWLLAHPPPVSKLDRRHTGKLRKRDNLLLGGGRGKGGRGWARAESYDRKKAWSSRNHSILSADCGSLKLPAQWNLGWCRWALLKKVQNMYVNDWVNNWRPKHKPNREEEYNVCSGAHSVKYVQFLALEISIQFCDEWLRHATEHYYLTGWYFHNFPLSF